MISSSKIILKIAISWYSTWKTPSQRRHRDSGYVTCFVMGHVFFKVLKSVKQNISILQRLEENQPACALGWYRHFCLYFTALGEVVPYVYSLGVRDEWCYIFRVFHFKASHHLERILAAFTNVLSAIIESCWNMHDICTLWLEFWIYRQILSSIFRTTMEASFLLIK